MPCQDLAEEVNGHGPGVGRVGMRAHDERVARLDADQGLEHERRHRVGHGNEPHDDPHRVGDLCQRLPLVAAYDTHARLPNQPLRHTQAREPVLVRLVGRAADTGLSNGRHGQLIRTARDLGSERGNKGIHLVLRPAHDAPLRRSRPCDNRIQGRIRLARENELLKVLGETTGLPCRTARQPAQHLDPGHGIAVAQFTQCSSGQAPGGDVTVRIHTRGPGTTVQQAELTAEAARPHERHDTIGVEVGPFHLHAHLTRGDEVTGVTWAALDHEAAPLAERHGFQIRLKS